MAKYTPDPIDPYLDVENGCLKNLLGIKNQSHLDRIEATFVSTRTYERRGMPHQGKFDLEHLKSIHHCLYENIYEWAGQLRQVDIIKGSTRFAHFKTLEKAGGEIFKELSRENHLQGLDADKFARRAGYYLGEINVLHPFREGNGRTQREFINQLAYQNGYRLKWLDVSREEMTQASIKAYHGDATPMATLLRLNLIDRDYERANELANSVADGKVQIEKAETGKNYHGCIVGKTERYVIQEQSDQPHKMVLHNRRALIGELEKQQGEKVEICYLQGQVGIVRSPETIKDAGKNKQSYQQSFEK